MNRGTPCLIGVLLFTLLGQIHAGVAVGDRPSLDIKTLDGMRITSQTLRGHVTVVDFWATWCGPCVKTMPRMKELYEQLNPHGVVFLGISLDKNAHKAESYVKQNDYNWPQSCDGRGWESPLVSRWGVNGIPSIFILDPSGEVIWTGHPANMEEPLMDAARKFADVMKQAMGKGKDKGEAQLNEQAMLAAESQLKAAGKALDADDFSAMLQALSEIPDAAYRSNDFALKCRSLYDQLDGLSREEQRRLNQARRSDRELAKAYGAFVKAARSARTTDPAS